MFRIQISVPCALLMFTLLGCGTLPKEKFLREQNDSMRTYQLWETSIEALTLEVVSVARQGSDAYNSVKSRFQNHVELIEYLNTELDEVEFRRVLEQHRIAELEDKMSPGDSLYLFELIEQKRDRLHEERRASGKLILNRNGNLIWREIEDANYPYWEEEPQYEELNRIMRRLR